LTYRRVVGAIVLAAAIATGVAVGLAGGAMAASKHGTSAKHHATTARLEQSPTGGTRDVGFTG